MSGRYSVIFAFAFIILTLLPFASDAQCFSAPGSPIGGTFNTGALKPGLLRVTVFSKYSFTDRYYEGSRRSDFVQYDHAHYLFTGTLVAIGLTKRFTFENELGYFPFKTVSFSRTFSLPYYDVKGYGFSTWSPSLKALLFAENDKRFFISASVGAKIPFSREFMVVNHIELPPDVQPSTGAYGWVSQLYIMKENSFKANRFFAVSRIESNGTNRNLYRFGDAFSQSLFFSKHLYLANTPFPENWTAIIQLRYEYRKMNAIKDITTANFVTVSGTGGSALMLTPQLNYTIKSKWNVSLSGEFPVYQYLNNVQLGRGWAVLLNLTSDFQLWK